MMMTILLVEHPNLSADVKDAVYVTSNMLQTLRKQLNNTGNMIGHGQRTLAAPGCIYRSGWANCYSNLLTGVGIVWIKVLLVLCTRLLSPVERAFGSGQNGLETAPMKLWNPMKDMGIMSLNVEMLQ